MVQLSRKSICFLVSVFSPSNRANGFTCFNSLLFLLYIHQHPAGKGALFLSSAGFSRGRGPRLSKTSHPIGGVNFGVNATGRAHPKWWSSEINERKTFQENCHLLSVRDTTHNPRPPLKSNRITIKEMRVETNHKAHKEKQIRT